MSFPIISAGSHITEPAETYVHHIDPAFADRAPRLDDCGPELGYALVIDGFAKPVSGRLLWANDLPHADTTWPWSQRLLNEHIDTSVLTAAAA